MYAKKTSLIWIFFSKIKAVQHRLLPQLVFCHFEIHTAETLLFFNIFFSFDFLIHVKILYPIIITIIFDFGTFWLRCPLSLSSTFFSSSFSIFIASDNLPVPFTIVAPICQFYMMAHVVDLLIVQAVGQTLVFLQTNYNFKHLKNLAFFGLVPFDSPGCYLFRVFS